ncbi:MAG TPA: helix-turn-helix domain-containing protein [Xanthobacteraceae bacterium]|nr:helix-turn-helix domain-containing protein [Xanthobacteraceae bacterium]
MVDEVAEPTLVCPVNATLEVISGKWKPSILCELRAGPRRFGELKREIPAISEKVLATDLRALESDGIVSRRQFYEGAVLATEYAFTDFGRTLIPALNALAEWGLTHGRPPR